MNLRKEENPDIVNFDAEANSIKIRYASNYWRSPDAIKDLSDLWGVSSNSSGALPHEIETVVHIGGCKGQLYFAHTSKDYWLTGLSASSSFNGVSYAPSVMNAIGYKSYQSARREGLKELIAFFDAVACDLSSCNSETNKSNALKTVCFLQSELTPQLSFFE